MLAQNEITQFVEVGFACVRGAFDPNLAEKCRRLAAEQLDIDLLSRTTWDEPVIRGVPDGQPFEEAVNSPGLLEAVGQLIDPDEWQTRPNLGAFVVRFPSDTDPGDTGWHIDSSYQRDGDERWFVNYRSRARGLLLLCLLSDVGRDDAPTRLLPGSHLAMPKLLRSAGEAGLPGAYPGQQSQIPLPDTSGPVELATGHAGDVFLCHPFLVHAASWPHKGVNPRFVSQLPISLAASLDVEGPLQRLSPVARAVRLGLKT